MSSQQLEAALQDADPERRREAVIELERGTGDDAAELVVGALGDDDWRVRKEAARVAAALCNRLELAPRLVEALCDGSNVGRRNAALEALGRLGRSAAGHLLAALPDVPAQARKFVIDALGDAADPSVVPALVRAAEEDDPNVAAAALDSLARIGGPEAEAALRRRLKAADPFERMAALDGLTRLGAVVPWEELEPLLSDRLVRRVALPVLGRTGRIEAIAPLLDALRDRSAHVVADAARALSHLYESSDEVASALADRAVGLSDECRSALRTLARGDDPVDRRAAVHLLVLARDEMALADIVKSAPELPRSTFEALRHWGERAIPPLLEVHRQSEGTARGTALELAADLGAERLVRGEQPDPTLAGELREVIRRALADAEPEAVLAAVRSMTWWAEAQDAHALVDVAARADADLAHACETTLESLAGWAPEAVQNAVEGVELEGPGGAALARVLARVGGASAFERLQTALSADDPATRRASVEGLAAIGGRRAAELIGYALTDEHVDVQTAAARALGRLRDESGRSLGDDALMLALQSDLPAVQAAAARALGEAGQPRAIEPLRALVGSHQPGVAVAAMEALRHLRDPDLGELLVDALGHEDPEVVKQALQAIREAEGERTADRLAFGLDHAEWDVRVLAARLLGEVGGDAAREALHRRLADETDDLARSAVQEALEATGGGR